MSRWPWLLGGGVLAGVLLATSDAFAAPAGPRVTINEDRLRIALARLGDFIKAARIDAVAHRLDTPAGALLGVRPGKAFVREDAAALPRAVDGLDVVIKDWPR